MSTIIISMFDKIFMANQKLSNTSSIFIGVFTPRGLKKFIKQKYKRAAECDKECHHSIRKLKGSRQELKFLYKHNDIKTVVTYILEEHELNKEL